ncbi:MAG: hypothetical protein ABI770_03130 [Sphingomicrobium sp.]
MKLHGSTEGNLIAALRSSRRLSGVTVHPDTLQHWTDVLKHADQELSSGLAMNREPVKELVAELKVELNSRGR